MVLNRRPTDDERWFHRRTPRSRGFPSWRSSVIGRACVFVCRNHADPLVGIPRARQTAERALSARLASEVNAALIPSLLCAVAACRGTATPGAGIPGPPPTPIPTFNPYFPVPRESSLSRPILSRAGALATVNIEFFGAIYEGAPRIQGWSFNPEVKSLHESKPRRGWYVSPSVF